MERIFSFKTDDERLIKFIESEAEKQYSSIAAVLRQIVFGHFQGIETTSVVENADPGASRKRDATANQPARVTS